MKSARTRPSDFKSGIVGVARCDVVQRKLAVGRAKRADGDCLAIAALLAPDQRHLYNRVRRTGQKDAPCVGLPFAYSNSRLREASRLLRIEFYQRRMISGKGRLAIHDDVGFPADGRPPARRCTPKARIPCGVPHHRQRCGSAGGDGVKELAVDEHLGPDAGVDDVSPVLEELAVDVLRDRRAGPRCIDSRIDRACLREHSGRRSQESDEKTGDQGERFRDRHLSERAHD